MREIRRRLALRDMNGVSDERRMRVGGKEIIGVMCSSDIYLVNVSSRHCKYPMG